MRFDSIAYLSMGSNLGRRRRTLESALQAFHSETTRLTACSGLYETEPVGLSGPLFVNLVCAVRTSLTPHGLHDLCLEVERRHGRRRDGSVASRTLDIDVLFFDDRLVSDDRLTIPHPRLAERNFVLEPLFEVAPDLVDPRSGLPVSSLRERCPDRSRVRRVAGPPAVPML